MSAAQTPFIDAEIVSFLSFWTDAGVDSSYESEPQDRLKPPLRAARASPPREAPPAAPPSSLEPPPGSIDTGYAIAEARRLAEAATDLQALEAAISGFDGCPLKTQGATRAVFARGRIDAPIMIIGEAPGADEDRQGEPFVGRAGQLLDRMLAAAGLKDDVFITNTVFWRPPGNRTPTLAEQAVCRPFVERAIQLIGPKLLLLTGGASAKSMLNTADGILSLRGRWAEWRAENGDIVIPALPMLHPAFLLRQPAAKKKAWADLLMLTAKLADPS